jgi:hypothetical protein
MPAGLSIYPLIALRDETAAQLRVSDLADWVTVIRGESARDLALCCCASRVGPSLPSYFVRRLSLALVGLGSKPYKGVHACRLLRVSVFIQLPTSVDF